MATGQAWGHARTNAWRSRGHMSPGALVAAALLVSSAHAREAPAPHHVAAGREGALRFFIVAESVRRGGAAVTYELVSSRADGLPGERRQVLADCERRVRAVLPRGQSDVDGTFPAFKVRAGSREAAELGTACDLLPWPLEQAFPGLIVSSDGVLIAPHRRTARCARVLASVAGHLRTARILAQENDLTLLQVDGGPFSPMAAAPIRTRESSYPVTMLGRDGISPHVGAAAVLATGASREDPGWPQVLTMRRVDAQAGPVWDASGSVVGFGVFRTGLDSRHAMVRMIPAETVQQALQAHGVHWERGSGAPLDPETALRAALAGTVPLVCEPVVEAAPAKKNGQKESK
jgi:hypothetical protein